MASKGPKRKRYDSMGGTLQIDPSSKEHVHELFEKKHVFHKSDEEIWSLEHDNKRPTGNTLKYHDQLQELKLKLNEVKDSLSDKDIENWHQHTKFMHLAGGVMVELKMSLHVELCTQAWCKFYEILSQFDIINEKRCSKVNSVHLCEAPGAFISSLSHYLKCRDLQHGWSWLATTLSPYHEGNSLNQMIDDDRFIRGTLGNWYFGEDGTGNIMNDKNIEGLVLKTSHLHEIQLVTADGSIDCQDSPAEQESLVSQLHHYETLTAFKLLNKGGCFVLKIFTMFEDETIKLLYILNCSFNQVSVFKPATSKPGNSEVYVICEGFTTLVTAEMFHQIFSHTFKDDGGSSSTITCPESFLKQHVECCRLFVSYQTAAIQLNLDTYDQMDAGKEKWQQSLREYCQEFYITKYKIRQIPLYSRIIKNNDFKKYSSFKLERSQVFRESRQSTHHLPATNTKHTGSFHERQTQSTLPWHTRLRQMELLDYSCDMLTLECQQPVTGEEVNSWETMTGKKVKKIESSKFCHSKIISYWNDLTDNKTIPSEIVRSNDVELCEELISQLASDSIETTTSSLVSYKCDQSLITELRKREQLKLIVIEQAVDLSSIKRGTIFCQIVTAGGSEVDYEVQRRMLCCIMELLKNMVCGTSVILQVTSCLTRYMAGLIFILSRCFMKTSVKTIPSVHLLHQFLYLQVYTGSLDDLDKYLQSTLVDLDKLSSENSDLTIVGVIPLINIINDSQFTRFITHANKNILIDFINSLIQSEKSLLQLQEEEEKGLHQHEDGEKDLRQHEDGEKDLLQQEDEKT